MTRPRPITTEEMAELRRHAKRVEAAERRCEELRRQRDQYLAELANDGARLVDMHDIVGLTERGIQAAVKRGRS